MRKGIIDILTLGCSKNLVDTEQLLRQFELNGYKVRYDSPHPNGEVVVVNTCGFIGDAKEESINTILSLVQAKKRGTIGKLYVMGCLSERYKNELPQEIPEVDAFYGKFNWKQLLNDIGKSYYKEYATERILTTPSHYAYVKIAEGCNRGCAYCAIPLITGRYKSRDILEIVQEVKTLVGNGVKEIQLIAQDLTYYGKELYGENKLPELVERLSDINGLEWIRLHYGYPAHFPFDVLRVMRERENVCNYFDIALQHINNQVLQRMRRNITKEETLDLIFTIRNEVPHIALRTTFMVGFPSETEDEFKELEEFVRSTRFERMGSFTYSEEEETYAMLHYKDDIPQEVKQERQSKLMLLQEGISEEMSRGLIGRILKVIIDREEKEYFVGRTEYDSPEVDKEVLIKKDYSLQTGNFYDVKITDATAFDLFGEVE